MLHLTTLNLTWTIRTLSFLHLPAIALAQARRVDPTIISMWMSSIQKTPVANFLKWKLG